MNRKSTKTLDAVRAVTRASERTVKDTLAAVAVGVHPLPGTIPYNIWICWRMAEELGLVDDDTEES